jgi:hypothetical protein
MFFRKEQIAKFKEESTIDGGVSPIIYGQRLNMRCWFALLTVFISAMLSFDGSIRRFDVSTINGLDPALMNI